MLKVQEYLQNHSLFELERDYAITHKFDDNQELVLLKYSQIDSPKANEIVRECRGLILQNYTWEIISMPFSRFFNVGEMASDEGEVYEIEPNFNFYDAHILKKRDGSLIQMYTYKNKWKVSTSGSINNDTIPDEEDDRSFTELVYDALPNKVFETLNSEYVYIFELTSPYNIIVKKYNDLKLTLLTVRNKLNNFEEVNYETLLNISKKINITLPDRIFGIRSLEELRKLNTEINTTDEGFVAIDYSHFNKETKSYSRVKVKNLRYVELHHLLSNVNSSSNMLSLIIQNEQEEIISYFPHFRSKFEMLEQKYNEYKDTMNIYKNMFNNYMTLDRKSFALMVNEKIPNVIKPFMFQLYLKQTIDINEYIQKQIDIKGIKLYCKTLLKTLLELNI